jgi:hypothetical protein
LTNDNIICIRQVLQKNWEHNKAAHQLFIDFKKAYDLVRTEVLHNILIEIGILMRLVRSIKMGLTETSSRIQVGKYWSDMFPIRNPLKEEEDDALSPLFFNFTLGYAIRKV